MRIAAFDSGLAGLHRAEQRLERAAAATSAPADRVSIGFEEAAVERLSASHDFRANLRVIQSAERLSDDLLSLLTR